MKNLMRRITNFFKLKIFQNNKTLQFYPPINPMDKAKKIINKQLLNHVEWKHNDILMEKLKDSRYYNIWKKFAGGYKKYSYFELYDRLFSEFSGKPLKVLEIGVYKGSSIHTWKEFFGERSIIVGIDVNPDCTKFEASQKNIYVRIGNQSDPRFLKQLTDEYGKFDIIIDDGSHLTHDIITTFNYAFLHCLNENGVYFIEDLNTSYWMDYRTSKYSAMDLVLSLIDVMHQFYFEHHHNDYLISNYRDHYMAPLIATLINEVRIFDSAVAIYKKQHYPPLVFHT